VSKCICRTHPTALRGLVSSSSPAQGKRAVVAVCCVHSIAFFPCRIANTTPILFQSFAGPRVKVTPENMSSLSTTKKGDCVREGENTKTRHYKHNHNMSGCVNALVCGSEWEGEGPRPGEDTCMTCGPWFKMNGFGFGKLDIDETPIECPICTETEPSVRFPQCTHRVCPGCFRDIMFWDETRHHLDPLPYGCPPCPNGCENPPRGSQCYCDEYDSVKDQWKKDFPVQFQKYNDDENESIETPIDNPTLASKKVPFLSTRVRPRPPRLNDRLHSRDVLLARYARPVLRVPQARPKEVRRVQGSYLLQRNLPEEALAPGAQERLRLPQEVTKTAVMVIIFICHCGSCI
jgi:hypothetical protein